MGSRRHVTIRRGVLGTGCSLLVLVTVAIPATAAGHAYGWSAHGSRAFASGTADQGASAPVSASPEPSALPSSAPSTPPVSGNTHDAPELEALLPAAVDGRPLSGLSVGPATWDRLGPAAAGSLKPLGDRLGVDATTISFAAANDPTLFLSDPEHVFNVFVIRVPGADAAALVSAFAAVAQASEGAGATMAQTTLAGIPATELESPSNPVGNTWFWAVNDVLFGVQTGTAETAARLAPLFSTELPPLDASPAPSAIQP